jgi:DNA-binding response OmpR family regulator
VKYDKRQKTILVVEDNPALRELLISCLQIAHYPYAVVEGDHNNPLAWIEDNKCLFLNGIIFDVDSRMADFKGLLDFFHAFCRQWKAFSTSPQMTPLVLLTTHPARYDELQREGYAVIMKPFKVPILLSIVKAVLEEEIKPGVSQNWRMDDARSK